MEFYLSAVSSPSSLPTYPPEQHSMMMEEIKKRLPIEQHSLFINHSLTYLKFHREFLGDELFLFSRDRLEVILLYSGLIERRCRTSSLFSAYRFGEISFADMAIGLRIELHAPTIIAEQEEELRKELEAEIKTGRIWRLFSSNLKQER